MKNATPSQPEQNHKWTQIDTNSRRLSSTCLGFHSCEFVFIRGSTGLFRLVRGLAALLIASALSFNASAASESPSLLLQKGIYAEEVERNLESAIKIYEQIAAESAANRTVVAQAQYRLAVCYQKQGKKEQAIAALNELVQQYPSDADTTKKARHMLADLGQTPSEGVAIRRLPSVAANWFMDLSADGRLLAYQPEKSFDLFVCETATGKTWPVAKGERGMEPWQATISPDGTQIAYTINGLVLWIAKTDGTESRKTLTREGKTGSFQTIGWSPDATRLVCMSVDTKSTSVSVLSLNLSTGESQEHARIANTQRLRVFCLSADGNYVAFRRNEDGRKIFLLDLRSGREEVLIEKDAVGVVGWTLGDSKIVFVNNRSGASHDLWAVAIKDGKSSAEPELIMSNLGFVEPFVTRDGRIYYAEKSRDLWVMEGFLTRKAVQKLARPSPSPAALDEFRGPNHSIVDRNLGFSATLPTGWELKSANRRGSQRPITTIDLSVAEFPDALPRLSLHIRPDGAPTAPAEVAAMLRNFAETVVIADRQKENDLTDYKNRPTSYALRTVAGRAAISWAADFKRGGKTWTEYLAAIYGDKLATVARVQVPAEKADDLRTAFESLVESVRLP
ncbi:MAG: tetratricopeptide repeat protein [Verrucomicrobia bacterium]|nr:tetratricopeptide repeat protein [Verrucomicrobiota bacterium]